MGIAGLHGAAAETLAAAYLALVGFEIRDRNVRVAGAEVDVLAVERGTDVIVEVKFRSRGDYGGAALAVSRLQRERLRNAARSLSAGTGRPVRIDLVALELEEEGLALRHVRNAIHD